MPDNTTPVPEIWGRMAMLLARNLPAGHDGDKLLDLWRNNPQAAYVTLNRRVSWSTTRRTTNAARGWAPTPADRDTYTELSALLEDAPPARRLTTAEDMQFQRGVDDVRFGRG
ncbi:hypothetical protein [Planotetraspora phitsanulokensis]|uniref:Uncharacterized protein n=1 Tax=Planotetraspora phitsanulokensis TaxID=575192 RepID=A0A8J3UQT4_9ACTN|nr:hypothetical protein [Planotetraspora phitsanulokensis]GII42960.1 hypothetical protein Pph01_79630 [Planotetraspora phitsanulokensis]